MKKFKRHFRYSPSMFYQGGLKWTKKQKENQMTIKPKQKYININTRHTVQITDIFQDVIHFKDLHTKNIYVTDTDNFIKAYRKKQC